MTFIVSFIGIGFALFCVALGVGVYMFKKEIKKDDPAYLLQFAAERANSKQVALSMRYNGQTLAELNAQTPLPLASTVKLMLALEYAHQVADGKINPLQDVSLETLDAFYFPHTDGGAHPAWVATLPNKKTACLRDVANGMILHSSNANTEYLMQLLGIDAINARIASMTTQHEPVYPIVSALAIPYELMQTEQLSKEQLSARLQAMPLHVYRELAHTIHTRWQTQPLTAVEKKQYLKPLSADVQKIWSDRLPRATTTDYVDVLAKLNDKATFAPTVYEELAFVLEQLMTQPHNREWLVHAGRKGGSTASVLTFALYATDKDGNRADIAFFANDLTITEQAKLAHNANGFQLACLQDAAFRERLQAAFHNKPITK